MKLLNGDFSAAKKVQAGANAGQEMDISVNSVSAAKLVSGPLPAGTPNAAQILAAGKNVEQLLSTVGKTAAGSTQVEMHANGALSTQTTAAASIIVINDAINKISEERATLGAMQNRLEYKIQNLNNAAENMAAAESRIRDADMAKMMTEFTKNNILFQASTAMLAQANALPQGVLQLLG